MNIPNKIVVLESVQNPAKFDNVRALGVCVMLQLVMNRGFIEDKSERNN
jgi:hypothetical protein